MSAIQAIVLAWALCFFAGCAAAGALFGLLIAWAI
jgi:hypothetical protein